jgi:hypothetical protein
MSIAPIDRRSFLTLALAALLAPARLGAEPAVRRGPFAVEVGILYEMLTFRMSGDIEERYDQAAGRYDIRVSGQGDGIASRIEATGERRRGRWVPRHDASWFLVRGRESRSEIRYDHDRRLVEYRARSETFFRRRVRVVDDTVPIPAGMIVDDGISALLNYRDGLWTPTPEGRLRTHVVRRRRAEHEGPDDVAAGYRAELAPLDLTVETDPQTQGPVALVDLSRFSSWAHRDRPARVVFDAERRPALITGSMILGTSLTIRLA